MSKSERRRSQPSGIFSCEGIDRVLHEKARLGILASLVTNSEGLLFSEIKELCSLTDGNLSRHLQVLQTAELVDVWKGHRGKRPQTLVRLTDEGRQRFLEYIDVLEQIVSSTLEAAIVEQQNQPSTRRGMGWSPA